MSANVDTSFFGIHEDIILTKEGVWLSNGEEITHPGTVIGFSRNIYRCTEGFEIRLGLEHKVFHAEDTIYFVTRLEGNTQTGFNLRLNDGRMEKLDTGTLNYKPGRLTCKVLHPNEKTHEEAKFLTGAYYELLKHVEKTAKGFEVTIEGKTILLSDR
ncbi:MAG: hypothetical protein JST80_01040 [Bdellovibrionales bacterium]|nr:hypothetical protein [Bdellovibrionales bacterium]